MSAEPILCTAQTYARTMVSPAEYCTNEVAEYGDKCEQHEDADRGDELYDHYRESLWEKQ